MTPQALALIVNLVPVLSVAVFGWDGFTLVLLYWIENLIVGSFNLLKILISGFTSGRVGAIGSLAVAPFFVFHYGLFCFVHGVFICLIFSADLAGGPPDVLSPANLAALVAARVQDDRALFWNVVQLAAFHAYIFLRYWVGGARWRLAEPFSQMFAPYARIVVVQLTILIAGITVVLLGQPMLAVLCLALLKTGLETGQMRIFDAFAENSALAIKTRRMLKTLGEHARH